MTKTPAIDKNLLALGLEEIINAVAARSATPGGRLACLSLRPARDVNTVKELLAQTRAGVAICVQRPSFVIEPCEDITPLLASAQKRATLRGGQLRLLLPVLRSGEAASSLFESMAEEGVALATVMTQLPQASGLAELIEESIDEDGNVRANATSAIEALFNAVNS
ncbi:MAG: hypothetical protein OEV92_06795, partial [Nitrospinota bacterium]|nr:hypothetical protein [Nitrospinota bacterium]